MAKTETHIPRLRFAGFSDPWQKKKLSKVFSIFAGNAFASKDQVEQGIKWLKISDVGIQRMNSTNLSYLPKGYEIDYFKYLVKKEDIVIALTRPILDGKLKISIIDDEYNGALLNQRVGKLISQEHNLLFIYTMLQKSDVVSKLEQSIAGTDPPNLSLNEIKDILLTVPQYQEQTKIGDFFQKIDQVIELQQKALETAQDYKKAMLQKMFPQKSEKVPKVRFDGFSGELLEVCAGEVFKTISEKNHPNLDILSATQDRGMVKRKDVGIDIKYDESTLNSYKKVTYGQFVIHLRSFQGGLAYSTIEGIVSPAYTIIDFKKPENFYPLYWSYIFTSKYFIKCLENITYGIRDGRTISFKDFSSLSFVIPKREEQQKIGAFFQKLDQQIEQHEKKLESYQQLKKAMLQRMFV